MRAAAVALGGTQMYSKSTDFTRSRNALSEGRGHTGCDKPGRGKSAFGGEASDAG